MPTKQVKVREHQRHKPESIELTHVERYVRDQEVRGGPPPGAVELGPTGFRMEKEDWVVTNLETGEIVKVRAPAHEFVTLRLRVETDEGSLCEDKSIQVLRSRMKSLDLTDWLEEAVEESAENLHAGGSDSETARGRIDLEGLDPRTGEYTWEPVEELEVRTEDY